MSRRASRCLAGAASYLSCPDQLSRVPGVRGDEGPDGHCPARTRGAPCGIAGRDGHAGFVRRASSLWQAQLHAHAAALSREGGRSAAWVQTQTSHGHKLPSMANVKVAASAPFARVSDLVAVRGLGSATPSAAAVAAADARDSTRSVPCQAMEAKRDAAESLVALPRCDRLPRPSPRAPLSAMVAGRR